MSVIASPPECYALSTWAETGGGDPDVMPAQAGIQEDEARAAGGAPGFRVSRCSSGMTGCHECRTQVEEFVSEQRSNLT